MGEHALASRRSAAAASINCEACPRLDRDERRPALTGAGRRLSGTRPGENTLRRGAISSEDVRAVSVPVIRRTAVTATREKLESTAPGAVFSANSAGNGLVDRLASSMR